MCFTIRSYYVLIDWVGGPDGKIFGSRSVRPDQEPDIFQSGPILLSQ